METAKQLKNLCLIAAVAVITLGCAHVAPTDHQPDPDPFEPVNRKIFKFNEKADKHILKPVAKGYQSLVPGSLREKISNFFSNINDIPSTVNYLLQGDVTNASENFTRLLINSTFGLGGILDVARTEGLTKEQTSFGETMVVWGANYSPYVVVPFLGPSTVRDFAGRVPDWYMTPWAYIEEDSVNIGFQAVRVLDLRASLLDKESLAERVSVDNYAFIRNAYLQRASRKGPGVASDEFSDPNDFELE